MEIDRASAEDLMYLASDSGSTPMQFAAVMVLDTRRRHDGDAGSDLAAARRELADRIVRVPRMRQRLVPTPVGCGRPIWVEAPDFDVHDQIRETDCPVPGDEQALLAVAARLTTERLPWSRPLWSATFVSGLADGCSALIVVIHHVLADGAGGLAVLARLLDPTTGGPAAAANPEAPSDTSDGPPTDGRPSSWTLAADAWRHRLSTVAHPSAMLRRLRAGLAELRPLRTGRAQRTSLNQPTGPHRRLTVVRADLAAVHRAARRHGASVNDVVLTAVGGALGTLLRGRGEAPEAVVASVPVAGKRTAGEADLGNRIGTMPVWLPTAGDPVLRLCRITGLTRVHKTLSPGASAVLLGPMFRILSAVGVLRWFLDHQVLVNTFVSNVRGPTERLAFNGWTIREIIPVSYTIGNVTVAFTVLSYAGELIITLVCDPDRCPDLPALVLALDRELDAFVAAPAGITD